MRWLTFLMTKIGEPVQRFFGKVDGRIVDISCDKVFFLAMTFDLFEDGRIEIFASFLLYSSSFLQNSIPNLDPL